MFYQDGIRAVGIDWIIVEAEVAKMSLYKHFPSKDDLILAVLQYRDEGVLAFFRSAMERYGKKAKKNTAGLLCGLEGFVRGAAVPGLPVPEYSHRTG